MSNHITRGAAPQTLTCEQYSHGVYWTGTAEQLIAAGLCDADQLPGAPGRNKISVCIKRRAFRIMKRGRFFQVYKSNDELKQDPSFHGFTRFMSAVLTPVDSAEEPGTATDNAPWPLTAISPQAWANMPEHWRQFVNKQAACALDASGNPYP